MRVRVGEALGNGRSMFTWRQTWKRRALERFLLFLLIVVLAAAPFVVGHAGTSVVQAAGTSILGTVIDYDDLPIANAKVTVFGTAIEVHSGLDGGFSIHDPPLGDAVVIASKDGYVTISRVITVESDRSSFAEIRLVELSPATYIGPAGGTVYGSDGTTIYVPSGALSTTVGITITPVPLLPQTASQAQSGNEDWWASWTTHLGPDGLQFDLPVTVTFPLDTSHLSFTPGQQFQVDTLNESTWEWGYRATATVNPDAVTASYQTSSFSPKRVELPGWYCQSVEWSVDPKVTADINGDGKLDATDMIVLDDVVLCKEPWTITRTLTTSVTLSATISTSFGYDLKAISAKLGLELEASYASTEEQRQEWNVTPDPCYNRNVQLFSRCKVYHVTIRWSSIPWPLCFLDKSQTFDIFVPIGLEQKITQLPTEPPCCPTCGGQCFIATAAYGSPLAEELDTFREFRDEFLLTNPIGSRFVSLYYRYSPPVARFIEEHPALKPVVRTALVPPLAMATLAVKTTLVQKMAIVAVIAVMGGLGVLVIIRRRRAATRE